MWKWKYISCWHWEQCAVLSGYTCTLSQLAFESSFLLFHYHDPSHRVWYVVFLQAQRKHLIPKLILYTSSVKLFCYVDTKFTRSISIPRLPQASKTLTCLSSALITAASTSLSLLKSGQSLPLFKYTEPFLPFSLVYVSQD